MSARPREILGLPAATALLILAFTSIFGGYMSTSSQHIVALLAVSAVLTLAGCTRKPTSAKTVAPPPPAPEPAAILAVNPMEIHTGQIATLTWRTENANDVSLTGVGVVAAKGNTTIRPQASTTYVLTAKGPGGSKEASARITVTLPPPVTGKSTPTDEELFSESVKDVFFAYDKSNIASNEESILEGDAKFLQAHSYMKLWISGHCDERGSEEYNLALGDSRADSVRDQLERFGIKADRIRTISYGKEKPFCSEETEACWQLNRRAHFSLQP